MSELGIAKIPDIKPNVQKATTDLQNAIDTYVQNKQDILAKSIELAEFAAVLNDAQNNHQLAEDQLNELIKNDEAYLKNINTCATNLVILE